MTTPTQSALSLYRAELAGRARLGPDDERALAAAYRSGDPTAGRKLVEGCLDAVVAIALEYRRWGAPIEDLIQEGNIGLLKAVEPYDPTRGVRFKTYAGYWIRAEIREYVARHYRIVRLGSSRRERRALRIYRKTREQRPEVLAELSGLPVDRVHALLPLFLSADTSLSQEPKEGGLPLSDRLPDDATSAEDALADAENRSRLRGAVAEAMAELPAREQDILRRRILAEDPETLEHLGATWGVSKERVRQIEQATKQRILSRLAPAMI
jgi:RNA polymerase sigma-32 factor